MSKGTHYSLGVNFALLLNRMALGLYFAIAGFNKIKPAGDSTLASRLSEFAQGVSDKAPLPRVLGMGYGYAIPFLEIAVGLLLFAGLFARTAAGTMAFMLCTFMIGYTGLSDGTKPFHANVIFLTLAILLAATGPGGVSLEWFFGRRRGRR